MTTHHFEPTYYYLTFGPHEPVLRVADGNEVVTTTVDAAGYDARGEQVAGRGNPLTGPFYVEGAEPGDTLAIHLDQRTNASAGRAVRARITSSPWATPVPWTRRCSTLPRRCCAGWERMQN